MSAKKNQSQPRQKKKVDNASKAKKDKSARAREKAEGIDNRAGQRIPIQLLVDYRCNGHYLFDFCRDLGAGGVFIQTSTPLPQGSKVDLTFTIPDSKETLETTGQVIWVQETVDGRQDLIPGMGVQFSQFDNDQRKVLEDFVHRYHGKKPFVDNEKKPA